MMEIYLDNGATSYPKPKGMGQFMLDYIENIGASIGRGAYKKALDSEGTVYETREMLSEMFNFPKAENVIFTKNITESINIFVLGYLKVGDHVVVSSLEHNAVMRPIVKMGLDYDAIPCDDLGKTDLGKATSVIRPNTKAIIVSHASNVCGVSLDLEALGRIAKEHGIPLVVDSAQSAGVLPIDMEKCNISFLGFTGHKSLLGPQGIGGFVVAQSMVESLEGLLVGGTGSKSDSLIHPQIMPDKYEAGTPNVVGIYGLNYSLKYIQSRGIKSIHDHELMLTNRLIEGISPLKGIRVIADIEDITKTGVVSIDFLKKDNGLISYELSKTYGISNRSGLHCSPCAHRALGTYPQGTVRLSVGVFNTIEEIDYTIKAVSEIGKAL